jgi:predicted NUDIX family NTP pyrophosphohydrolase
MLPDVQLFYRVKRAKTSAGLLMFRRKHDRLEVLLVHPGGPFFRKKEDGAWTIPKGEVAEGEELVERAIVEFREELGIEPTAAADWIELGTVKQKGGKTVHAWAFEGDLPEDFAIVSNTFSLEWPPRSGRTQEFPEIDRAEFFPIELAKEKINEAQIPLLNCLVERIRSEGPGAS